MKVRMILAFIVMCAVPLIAQTFRGTILGTVTDPSGAVVSGAKVTVKNVSTGLERTTETSADGSYSIPELPIGAYSVTITQSGFQTSVTSTLPDGTFLTFLNSVGHLRTQGVEIDAAAKVTSNFQLNGSFAYTNATVAYTPIMVLPAVQGVNIVTGECSLVWESSNTSGTVTFAAQLSAAPTNLWVTANASGGARINARANTALRGASLRAASLPLHYLRPKKVSETVRNNARQSARCPGPDSRRRC